MDDFKNNGTSSAGGTRGRLLLTLIITLVVVATVVSYHYSISGHAQSAAVRNSDTEEQIVSPGMSSAARVRPLASSLPAEEAEKLRVARAQNEWLLCENRKGYESVKYTYHFTNHQTVETSYRVEGKYDRGVCFFVPSEYALFYGKNGEYRYEEDGTYFKIVIDPEAPLNTDSGNLALAMYHYGIPNFINWANPVHMSKPLAWRKLREEAALPLVRDYHGQGYGYQFWFAKPDMRLVREAVYEPASASASENENGMDVDRMEKVIGVTYEYAGNEEYPSQVLVHQGNTLVADLRFSLVEGFWFFESGELYSYGGDERYAFSIWTEDVAVRR